MTRVLVTAARATVGDALVRALLEEPDVELVVGTDVAREGPSLGARFHYLPADLARERDVRTLLFGPVRTLGVDTVVHTALHASATHGGPRAHALDVISTRELVRAGEHHPTLRRFVYRSFAEVYHVGAEAVEILDEEHPLELSPDAPQWVRDRVEADLAVCAHAGLSPLSIAVLRCAEIFAPGTGSQLHDYVTSRVCFRPLGYDPMVELLSVRDAVRALTLAARSDAAGVFNIPGADILPLSEVVARCGRVGLAIPGPLLAPLYRLRALAIGSEFRYDMNRDRFHFGAVLDGRRAAARLGYTPRYTCALAAGRVPWKRPAAAPRRPQREPDGERLEETS